MNKLKALRGTLAKYKLAGFIQPVHDEYRCEYPPACNRRVEWLTGFSGSAGTAVVLAKKAALFTDGRYTLQAKNEVDGKIFEQYNSGDKSPEAWIAEQFLLPNPPPRRAGEGIRIAYDPKLYTQHMLRRMQAVLEKKGVKLVPVANLVDAIWADRLDAPASALFIHMMKYAGESSLSKRKRMAKEIKEVGADAALITSPESICWLLNVRASDVVGTPIALCTAILGANAKLQLYIARERCDAYVRTHLGKDVELREPAKLEAGLKALKSRRVLCDPAAVPVWFTQALGKAAVDGQDPCGLAKALKNPVELQGIRNAHIRDGVAVAKLLCWLDREVAKHSVSEMEICDKLLALRASHPLFVEPSFPTISGSGAHGAIVHYRVSKESNRALKKGELMLLDSGGQYPDGTTDITRTVPVGEPTPEHKDRFTRVLKGHIAIATARFPKGTVGSQLDALARQYLWQAGLDYDHGTGHGVGHFLSVHEGPQRISKRGGDAKLMPGMIVSNEPGYYKAGEYGIRIESLVIVAAPSLPPTPRLRGTQTLPRKREREYLSFETVTCVPIDTRLVDDALLTAAERQWLNGYHAWVFEKLSESLDGFEREWLKERCKAM